MLNEQWRTCKENSNYEISNFGNVRNKFKKNLIFQGDNGHGYKNVMLYNHQKRKVYYVHRLVANAFIPNPDNLPQVNHIDGNKSNNCVANLEWVTISENMIHASKNGLKNVTERVRENARNILKTLTPEQLQKGRMKLKQICKEKNEKGLVRWERRNQFKPLYCIELRKVFLCASRVQEKLGIKRSAIQKAMLKNYNTCGGYHWRYLRYNRFAKSY